MDTQTYKTRLQEELVAITADLAELGIHNPGNVADWIATPNKGGAEADPNVAADRVEDWTERRSVLSQLETRYNNVRNALAKIDAGTYGICEVGGEQIEADRLDANPAARTCKTHMEKESPQ